MKNLTILLAMVLLLAVSVSAGPVDKGSMIVGGELGFTSAGGDAYENADGDGQTSIQFMPFLAYFVAPSIAVGGEVLYNSASWGDYSESTFGVGPTVAYFFNLDPTRTEIKGTMYPFVQAFFKYGKNTVDSGVEGADEVKTTATYFGAKGGVMYMATDHWALNANVFYQSETLKLDDAPEGADDSISGNTLGLHVGLTAFLF